MNMERGRSKRRGAWGTGWEHGGMEGQMESDRASNFFRGKAQLYGDREEAESTKHES